MSAVLAFPFKNIEQNEKIIELILNSKKKNVLNIDKIKDFASRLLKVILINKLKL